MLNSTAFGKVLRQLIQRFWTRNKMHCVPDDLKELEGIFKAPRLYLIDYFTSIIHNIDVACEKFLISHKGIISRTQVFETHELMVERVKSIQDNCLKKLTKGWFDSSQVKEIKRTIDSLQNNETDKLLYDCKTKLFSLMFSNTMVVFLTKEKCPDLYNLGLIKSFGSLLVVQDEFIGNKAFDNLGYIFYRFIFKVFIINIFIHILDCYGNICIRKRT